MKNEAEFRRVALNLGLYTVAEVIAWCDEIIMAQDHPDIAIIEASLYGSDGCWAVSSVLMGVEGKIDKPAITRRFLHWFLEIITCDRSKAEDVAKHLVDLEYEDYGVPNAVTSVEDYVVRFYYAFDEDVNDPEGIEKLTNEIIRFLKKQLAAPSLSAGKQEEVL
jgi:hypothetical protein